MIRLLPPAPGETRPRTVAGMPIPLVEAENFSSGRRSRVDVLTLHSTEGGEILRSARNTGAWFRDPRCTGSSADIITDNLEIIQAIERLDVDMSWHAGTPAPNFNRYSIGIEQAGKAEQTADQWRDEYSMGVLQHTIEILAWLCKRFDVPAEFVDSNRLQANKGAWLRGEAPAFRGITTHFEVNKAWPNAPSKHWDPGPGYPTAWVIERVTARLKEWA